VAVRIRRGRGTTREDGRTVGGKPEGEGRVRVGKGRCGMSGAKGMGMRLPLRVAAAGCLGLEATLRGCLRNRPENMVRPEVTPALDVLPPLDPRRHLDEAC